MLEGVAKQQQQNETLRVAQGYREKLEQVVHALCMDFEIETGLEIKEIKLARSPYESLGQRIGASKLDGVSVKIEL